MDLRFPKIIEERLHEDPQTLREILAFDTVAPGGENIVDDLAYVYRRQPFEMSVLEALELTIQEIESWQRQETFRLFHLIRDVRIEPAARRIEEFALAHRKEIRKIKAPEYPNETLLLESVLAANASPPMSDEFYKEMRKQKSLTFAFLDERCRREGLSPVLRIINESAGEYWVRLRMLSFLEKTGTTVDQCLATGELTNTEILKTIESMRPFLKTKKEREIQTTSTWQGRVRKSRKKS